MQFTAKTVEEATEQGLKALNLTEEEAVITVVEKPVKGLFGRLKSQAIVDIEKKEIKAEENLEKDLSEAVGKEAEFLAKVLEYLGIEAKIEKSIKDEKEVYTVYTDKSSFIIGYRGEVLDALQTLLGAFANIGKEEYKKVVVDCENYRDKREDTLISLAHRLEEKATEMRREVILEPMSPFERRIIHNELSGSATVTTRSDGVDPNRYIVIVPNDKDEFSTPFNAGRKQNDRHRSHSSHQRRGNGRKSNGSGRNNFGEKKKSTSISFGTYLGNSLKDKD